MRHVNEQIPTSGVLKDTENTPSWLDSAGTIIRCAWFNIHGLKWVLIFKPLDQIITRSVLTVRDCPKRNRLSTRVSLGSLNTILTLSGSSEGGSGGRHSDFLSFSSSSVWSNTTTKSVTKRTDKWRSLCEDCHEFDGKFNSLVVSAPQRERSVWLSPLLASAAPAPLFSFAPSPGQHGGRPGKPHPAAVLALGSGSSPPWNKSIHQYLQHETNWVSECGFTWEHLHTHLL